MASLIQRVAVLALETFSKTTSATVFSSQQQKLTELVNQVTAADVNVSPSVLEEDDTPRGRHAPPPAPVTYLHLWEDSVYSMGVFVLRRDGCIPMHDHPTMHGIIKVLFGTLKVIMYNNVKEQNVPYEVSNSLDPWHRHKVRVVAGQTIHEVTPDSEPCCLHPEEGNIHEISAVGGPAAFLDILAPPYDMDSGMRECHYYKEIPVSNGLAQYAQKSATANSVMQNYLLEIPQPKEFWCDAAEYTGPFINPYQTST